MCHNTIDSRLVEFQSKLYRNPTTLKIANGVLIEKRRLDSNLTNGLNILTPIHS